MNPERRVFLVLLLMLGLSFILQYVVYPRYFPKPAPQTAASQPAPTDGGITTLAEAGVAPVAAPAAPAAQAIEGAVEGTDSAAAPSALTVAASDEFTESITTPLYTLTLSNRGAELTGMRLFGYSLRRGEDTPINLLAREPQPDQPGFLGLGFESTGLAAEAANALFVPKQDRQAARTLDSGSLTLAYQYTSPQGLSLEKRFTLQADSYTIETEIVVANLGTNPLYLGEVSLVLGNRLGTIANGFLDLNITKAGQYAHYGPLALVDGSKKSESFEIKKPASEKAFAFSGDIAWAAVDTPYFLFAVAPADAASATRKASYRQAGERAWMSWALGTANLQAGQALASKARVLVAPKRMDVLKPLGIGLETAIDYGWFTFFGVYLFQLLGYYYSFVGNYGISIILLTLTVRVLLLAFTFNSIKGMQKMQELQPKIQHLQKTIKDRNELNQKIMQLYQEEGVNPMTSCLPMFFQIPIFIALFNVLNKSIELRHAPFYLWITDLSAADATSILPILMGLTTFAQQAVTPMANLEKSQVVMMRYFMPFFLTAVSWSFPAGLVIYWTTNNMFTIVQQYSLQKLGIIKTPPKAAASSPANNAPKKKKNGGSKS